MCQLLVQFVYDDSDVRVSRHTLFRHQHQARQTYCHLSTHVSKADHVQTDRHQDGCDQNGDQEGAGDVADVVVVGGQSGIEVEVEVADKRNDKQPPDQVHLDELTSVQDVQCRLLRGRGDELHDFGDGEPEPAVDGERVSSHGTSGELSALSQSQIEK